MPPETTTLTSSHFS